MATTLGSKAVGSVVKIKVGGAYKNFLVVHQGKPGSMYDESCYGTWVLMEDCYAKRAWHGSLVNDYLLSDINSYLNNDFLKLIEADVRLAVKQVRIPYRPGSGTSKEVASGASGMRTKIFLLSATEVNTVWGDTPNGEGAVLNYFSGCPETSDCSNRVAKFNGSSITWWLRSPGCYEPYGSKNALAVNGSGGVRRSSCNIGCANSHGVRPAFVLPSTLLVNSDGTVVVNTPPAITGPTPSGSNLGTKEEGFDFPYTVTDVDGDAVIVKEYLDNIVKRSYQVTLGQENTFEAVTAAHWQTVLNGSHTLKVVANDGKADSAPYTTTFSKAVYSASITMAEPLPADALISVAVLSLTGSIPEDAALQVQLTNNGKDPQPVWEDATPSVKNGSNHVFANQTAANGFAFNFKVTVSRGSSGQRGHISKIGGAFQ